MTSSRIFKAHINRKRSSTLSSSPSRLAPGTLHTAGHIIWSHPKSNMITKTALRMLSITYRIACFTNSVPFQWDAARLKLVHTESRLRLAIFYFNIWSEWLYTLFKTVRLFYAVKHASFFVVIIHFGWLSRDILLSAFHLASVRRRKVVPEFFNKLLHYDQHILKEYARKQKVEEVVPAGADWCKLYHLGISFPVSVSFPMFLALFGWVLAPHPQFMASLFSDGKNHPETHIKVFFLVLELWINYTSFFTCYFYTCTLFCAIQSLRYSIKLLSVPPQAGIDYGESITRSKKMYRTMEVLNNYLNDCWRNIIAPVQQAVDLVLGSTYTCGFIKYHHTMGFVTLFCFLYQVLAVAGCTSSTYSIAGRLPRWTERIFSCWKQLELDKITGSSGGEYDPEDEDGGDGQLRREYQRFGIDKDTRTSTATTVREVLGSPQPSSLLALPPLHAGFGVPAPTMFGIGMISNNRIVVQKLAASRRSVQIRHLKAFMKSCKPLYMKTGNFFTVDRNYGLGWFSWYVENTVSLVLAFKDK